MYILQFDGMSHQPTENSRKGLLGYGWLITNHGSQVAHGFGLFAHNTMANSNIAEYLALIEGLEALTDLRLWHEPIQIRGDAKCVIDQMKGIAAVSSPSTRELAERAQRLARRFDRLTWVWIPRKKNKIADQLSRRGLRQLHVIPNAYEKALNFLKNPPFAGGKLIPVVDLRVYNPLKY